MLKGNVEIGQNLAFRHQRQHLVDMRIGVDVMQPHPDAELAEFAREIDEPRAHGAVLIRAFGVTQIAAIGAGVLRDDQQFLHARAHQFFGLAQNIRRRARDARARADAG